MAGIGFSLKKLFARRGLFGLCQAYGYAGLICAGPMILGILLLLGVSAAAGLAGMARHDGELLNSMITYCLLVALTMTSVFNMVNTRYVSDMIYQGKLERVMPSFHGCLLVMLPMGCVLWGVFLHFSGVAMLYRVMCMWFAATLMVVWMQMNYLNALKDYKALVSDFAVSLAVGAMLAALLLVLRAVSVATLFGAVIVSYGLLMALYYRRLIEYFPKSEGSCLLFLAWFERFGMLTFSGIFVNLGLFAHLVIMYYGPVSVQVEGLFRGAPVYDVAALCAFLSILITTVNFVTSVETNFYPRYHTYYSLFNDEGAIRDIDQAEREMLEVLRRELEYNGFKQLFCTIIFVVFGSFVLNALPLGFSETSIAAFRILCVGYGLYALANTLMLVLLYFEDYLGALLSTGAFALVSIAGTVAQLALFETEHLGVGFLLGGAAFYLIAYGRLEWYTRHLPYFLLGRQAMVPSEESGPLSRLCARLESNEEKR